jgi:hypothetical protein
MAVLPHLNRPASRITLDWMLVLVAVIAVALLIASNIRVDQRSAVDRVGTSIGGLRSLAPNERLIVFEDYSYDSGGWSGAPNNDSNAAMGGVLGPITAGAGLTRRFGLPDDTERAEVMFDLIGWSDGTRADVTLRLNDLPVLGAITSDAVTVWVDPVAPRRHRVWAMIEAPERPLTLTVETPRGAPDWALDNLTVIAHLPAIPED